MTGPQRFEKGMRVRLRCAPFDLGIVQGRGWGAFTVYVRWLRYGNPETQVSCTMIEPANE